MGDTLTGAPIFQAGTDNLLMCVPPLQVLGHQHVERVPAQGVEFSVLFEASVSLVGATLTHPYYYSHVKLLLMCAPCPPLTHHLQVSVRQPPEGDPAQGVEQLHRFGRLVSAPEHGWGPGHGARGLMC
jgi:hypothetical protein